MVSHSRQSISRGIRPVRLARAIRAVWFCLLATAATVGSGCRSGTSSMSAPSWWSFGGAGTDPSKLASAPPFDEPSKVAKADGKIQKPSETATPYPTTSTPNGYAIAGVASAGGQPAAATPTVPPPAVTYGTAIPSPPPAQTSVAATPAAEQPAMGFSGMSGAGSQTAPTTVSPQVGPYASLSGQPPAAAAPGIPPAAGAGTGMSPATGMSGMGESQSPFAGSAALPPPGSAVPAAVQSGGFPATAGYEPAARVADSRVGSSIPAAPPAAASAVPSAAGLAPIDAGSASRYGTGTGSRFGGGDSLPIPPAEPAPQASGFPAPPPPATLPGGVPAIPASAPATPSAPPTRRPDPGYRPGGTSSYRPSRTILVDDEPAAAGPAVRTATYEVPDTTQR